jgi:hypothetical protein
MNNVYSFEIQKIYTQTDTEYSLKMHPCFLSEVSKKTPFTSHKITMAKTLQALFKDYTGLPVS